ncbi:MAG: methionyl-tRNA formyltransferase [Xanthomonadales bacterium]|nr:methionyl-tRNA formyltransferase [Xanthomonadales bacterium]
MRIVFAGTPDFAVPSLEGLLGSGHEVVAVYTQPDRPAGRGRKLTPSPVKQVALASNIPVMQPASLRNPEAEAGLAAVDADLMVVAAYGLILPQAILDLPRLGCWNIHGSLLPRWRGAAPIQRAILAGDRETGVCIMQMEAGLDTGPVFSSRATPIADTETAGDLHDRLAIMGGELLLDTLSRRSELSARPQDDAGATYASKLEKAEAWLDWNARAVQLSREVRAFNPWPVSRTRLAGEDLRVWQAQPVRSGVADPGTVIAAGADGVDVACGDGVLRLLQVQRPGGRPVAVGDFLNARPLQTGDRFEPPPKS